MKKQKANEVIKLFQELHHDINEMYLNWDEGEINAKEIYSFFFMVTFDILNLLEISDQLKFINSIEANIQFDGMDDKDGC